MRRARINRRITNFRVANGKQKIKNKNWKTTFVENIFYV